MPAAGFQVGAVRGRNVVLAKGLEVDLARILARRLGIQRVRFLNERFFSTLLAPGAKDWDLALAEISVTPARAQRVDFSRPYLTADQGVVLRRGLKTKPASIAALRALQLCAERATTGAQVLVKRIKPTKRPLLLNDPSASFVRAVHETMLCDRRLRAVARGSAPAVAGSKRRARRAHRHAGEVCDRVREGQSACVRRSMPCFVSCRPTVPSRSCGAVGLGRTRPRYPRCAEAAPVYRRLGSARRRGACCRGRSRRSSTSRRTGSRRRRPRARFAACRSACRR